MKLSKILSTLHDSARAHSYLLKGRKRYLVAKASAEIRALVAESRLTEKELREILKRTFKTNGFALKSAVLSIMEAQDGKNI